MKYAKKYKKEIILGPIFKFMEAVFELLLPIFMARLIDLGIKENNEQYVLETAGTMVLMSVIGLVCVVICQYFSSVASQGFGTELRNALMKKINVLSHKELDDFGTATLITRMTGDINQLQLALAMLIRLVIRAPFLSLGSIIMAFYIQPKMAIIFIVALPVFCLILYFIMKKTVPLYLNVQQKIDHFNRVLQENLSGVRVIRAFAQKKPKIEEFGAVSDELAFAYTNVANISAILNPATTLIMNSSVIALLYFGGIHVNTGNMQQGEVLALINYMIQMLLSLIVVANLVIIFTRASASATRVKEVLAIEPIIQNPEQPVEVANIDKSMPLITFDNVDFKYHKDSGLAVENIDFQLNSQEMLGIIGPTGSGKSTILELIPRFYDTTSGNIFWNGTDIREIPLAFLRDNIAIVPQKSVLFSGTIRENLQWGKKDATEEECWDALATAQCLSFVKSLPKQLDAPILANGKNLSGGQKQRLTIARAVIKKPKLLLMDDSLSALDYRTDLDLRQALRTDLKETGIIIVSQRVSSIQQADQILVMDEGKQIALGTHEELLKISHVYRNIYHLQVEKEV